MWKEKINTLISRKEIELLNDKYFKEELELELKKVYEKKEIVKKEIELSGVYIPDNFSFEFIDLTLRSINSKINKLEEKRLFEKFFGDKNPEKLKKYEDEIFEYNNQVNHLKNAMNILVHIN